MREKRFLIEGAKNVREVLNSDYQVELVIGTEDFLFGELNKGQHRSELVSPDLLSELGTFQTNDSALAVAQMKESSIDQLDFSVTTFLLDGVSDPGNMGTIIRTLDWFGFDQLVCTPDCADFYHPKVVNSTMGSFARVKYASESAVRFLSKNKLPVVAADMKGTFLEDASLDLPLVVVMGSESHGVSDDVKSFVNHFLTIPGAGKAESLNVGVATGIIANHLRMAR